MALDVDLLTTVIVIALILSVFMVPLMAVMNWIFQRRNTLRPTPIDVHEMLVHKLKKAGRRNAKGLRVKWLYCTGDNDHPGFTYGRLYGLLNSTDCVISFPYNGRRHLSRVSAALHPIELTGDVMSKNLTVNCRGFRFKSNFLVPIWPNEVLVPETGQYRKVTPEDRVRWEQIIDNMIMFLVTQEKIEQMHEENVNACIESVNIKAEATGIYERDEFMRRSSQEERKLAEEDVTK